MAYAFVTLSACRQDPSVVDAASDAQTDDSDVSVVAPSTIAVQDSVAAVAISGGPTQLRVTHPDGTVWVHSPADRPFLEVGCLPNGPSLQRFHDPRVESPANVTWVSPRVRDVLRTTSETLVMADACNGSLTLSLMRVSDGSYAVRLQNDGSQVAMWRMHLAADDGTYHGLGERFSGVNARGQNVAMQLHVAATESATNETHVPVPFLLSSRGYGVFVESREAGAFDVAALRNNEVTATFEGSSATIHLYADAVPWKISQRFVRETGLPRLPPAWVHGPQQWRNVWRNQDELLSDARRLRAEGIATTTMWIDNPWQVSYNDHVIDTQRFPNPAAMFSELSTLGYRVIVWSTPYLDAVEDGTTPDNTAEQLWDSARTQGHLVRLSSGVPFVSPSNPASAAGMQAQGSLLDFTSSGATSFWSSRLDPLLAMGVQGFKLDYGEDVVVELAGARPRFVFSNGESERVMHSLYPQLYHAAYRAAIDRAGGDGFLIVRASSWGGQRVCDVIWPGDLDNDFSVHDARNTGGLPASINAMISLSESGFPNFGADTGGYRNGRPTKEALLRWAEHTAVSMVMQLGGGGESHNPWDYDLETTDIYRRLARLHNDLVPYLRERALAASREGTPPVRSLALAFPEDPTARNDAYTYLLGDDLLMAPVVVEGATTRLVHIPSGTWVHWFDGTSWTGPRDVTVNAPLGTPALFIRQGAMVPLLADDVATLRATSEPSIVDASDRASVLRLRSIPAGTTTLTLEDGARIQSVEQAQELSLQFVPGTVRTELRAQIDLAHRQLAGQGLAAVQSVTNAGTPLMAMPNATAVQNGCDGCWFHDANTNTLYLSARGTLDLRVR